MAFAAAVSRWFGEVETMVQIKNTIQFAYPNESAKPTMEELARFLKTLDANRAEMNTMYRVSEEKSVFVKFNTEESMNYAVTHNPEQLSFHYANGKTVQVRMSVAGGNVQYVRIFDLPPEVPDKDVSLVLGKYGKVKRVIREKFPAELGLDMFTGVRGIYMDVEKEIPSSYYFLNRKGNIFYSGNKDTCFHCKAVGHQMSSCPKRKARKQPENHQQDEERKTDKEKRNQDEGRSETSSYAGVVAGAAATETTEVFDDEVMAIDESTSETEEEEASGSQDYQKSRKYLEAKAYLTNFNKLLKEKAAEMNKEEKRKLRARKNQGSKQSPPRKK